MHTSDCTIKARLSESSNRCHSIERIDRRLKEFKKFKTEDIRRLLVDRWALLEAVAEALETITISTDVSIFVNEEKSNKLHRYVNGVMSCDYYDIEPGNILAAYSAYTKKIQTAESPTHDINFPLGIGKTVELHVLSLPVVTPNEKVLAVIELYRDLNGEQFSEEDQLIGLTISNWLAASYEKHFCSQKLGEENYLHHTMFKILREFFKVNPDIDKLIECIAKFIKTKMPISKFNFYRFVMNRQHWAYNYEEVAPNKFVRSKIPKRFNKTFELVSIVLKTHKNLNLNIDNLDDKYIPYLNILRNKGIVTILLVPIIRSGFVMGVMELINKEKENEFTKHDEEFLENVSKYYSLALHYTNVLLKHKKIEEQLRDGKKLLLYMLEPCIHDFNDMMNKWCHIKTKSFPEYFMSFSYYPWQANDSELIEQSLILFNYTIRDIFESDESMIRFVMMSRKLYRKNYYHNFEHAFNVMHFIINIKECVEPVLTHLEWKSLIVAAFCHDMDHPGFTNNFLKATSHFLVQLYQESVLENHHSYVGHLLIKELKLFSKFSKQEYKFIMNEIYETIIATDLAVYFTRSQHMTSIIANKSFSWFEPEHVKLLKSLIITLCDLSAQWKTCDTVVNLTMELYKEFYLQGDKEKALGLKPISMMDRDLKKSIPTDQINFIMLICIPCAEIVMTFLPQLYPIFMNVEEVLNYWFEEKRKIGFSSKEEEAEEEARLNRVIERINSRLKKKN